jgi:hypothetical protein
MRSRKLSCVISIAAAAWLVRNAPAATSYNWSGQGDGTSWGQAANWVQGVVPPASTDTFQIFLGTGFPTTSPKALTLSVTDVVQCTDQVFGPEWGQTLNIYGTMTNGFGFAPVGAVGGPQSHVNMYGSAAITSSDSIFIGDMFWFAGGPNVVMNMFDNSQLTTRYLALGGHLNIYGGAVTVSTFPLVGPANAGFWGGVSSDLTRRFNLVNGKLTLPTGMTATVTDWMNRGIFLAYGKINPTNEVVITDDGTSTVVTNIPLGGPLQSVFFQPLNQTNMVVGTFQQAKLLGSYPNVNNVLLSTAEPGVVPSTLPGVVSFTSSDVSILTVNADGLLSATKPGSATVKAVLGTFTNTVTVNVIPATTTLLHRYSFNETTGSSAADSVGGASWNGTLNGDASFSGTGQLVLSGNSGSSVTLPSGIVSNLDAVTVEAWATFPSTIAQFATLFAFGDTDMIPFDPNNGLGQNYIMMSPHSTTNTPGNIQANFGVGTPGFANERDAVLVGSTLDNQANVHIVAVFNPLAGSIALYTNGVTAATFNNLASFLFLENAKPNPLPDVLGADPLNYIGQSLYVADPPLLANIDEFRIYRGALTPSQVAADYALGANQLIGTSTSAALSVSFSGGNLIISWPTTSALVNLMSSSTLGPGAVWTQVTGALTTDGSGHYRMSIPATSAAQLFRLQL